MESIDERFITSRGQEANLSPEKGSTVRHRNLPTQDKVKDDKLNSVPLTPNVTSTYQMSGVSDNGQGVVDSTGVEEAAKIAVRKDRAISHPHKLEK